MCMKRFLLFTGADYYPSRAWEDFRGDFTTVAAAKEDLLRNGADRGQDWWQIVDSTIGQIVDQHGR